MFPKNFKTIKVGTTVATNTIKDLDSDLARTMLAIDDTRREITGDLITAGIGLAINMGIDMLPPEIMLTAVDGSLDITDFIEAADGAGDLLIGGAVLSAGSKLVRNFNNLSGIRDMSADEFEEFLSGKTSKKDKLDLSKLELPEIKEVEVK